MKAASGDLETSPWIKYKHLFITFEETIKAMASMEGWHRQVRHVRKEILVGWEPPPVDWVALNTDSRSRKNPDMAKRGGVFRSWKGCRLHYRRGIAKWEYDVQCPSLRDYSEMQRAI